MQVFGAEHELGSAISSEAAITLASGQSALRDMSVSDGDFRVLLAIVETPPRLLVLGGGPDADPVTAFVAAMGWHCTVVDHRPAYIDNGQFSGADSLQIDVDALSDILNLDDFDLAIVMSHHLSSDRSYLRQLSGSDISYIGLLGPANRRKRLLSELGAAAELLTDRLHGPAGLDIGGSGPAPIALSIVAQMQMHLSCDQS